MDNKEFSNVASTAKLSNFQVLNSDFVRCKCNVFYTGKNRNYSNITDKALQKFVERKGYANVPVIGHIKTSPNTGKPIMGSHDRKIEITNEGIKEINECVAYGVVPLDANPRMEKIIDVHGIEREYFTVDIILWTHYFPELLETMYSDEIYFNHSMEISLLDTEYEEPYTIINDFSLQALCLLGKYDGSHGNGDISDNSEPCFEDSMVKRFSLDERKFKSNFELMLEKLKQFKTENNSVNNNFIQINKKEETTKMDYSKVSETLAQYKIADTDVAKYGLLTVSDTSIGILDLEDYSAYTVNCAESDGAVILDMDNKVQCALGIKEFVEGENFDLAGNIESVKAAAKSVCEAEISKVYQEEYNSKIDEMTQAYAELKKEFDIASEELNKFKQADKARKEAAHKAEIDAVVEQYEKKIGRLAEFLCYRAKLDYTKSVEDVTKELTLMVGRTAMDKNGKSTFSYNPVVAGVSTKGSESKYASTERYGTLLDKYINKD